MTEQPRDPQAGPPAPARHGPAGLLVAAWLALTAGFLAWNALTGRPWWAQLSAAPVALFAAAAIPPFLRFRRIGWELAMWALLAALVMFVVIIFLGTPYWAGLSAAAGMCAFSLGYTWRTRAAFLDPDDDAGEPAHGAATPAPRAAEPAAPSVADAMGAVHRRIVSAGSACAVTREALLAEAARFGVGPEVLRTEGIPLYRTFLDHFRADGPLTAEEKRELWCLERALELDEIAVARMQAETADRPGAGTPAPPAAPVDGADRTMEVGFRDRAGEDVPPAAADPGDGTRVGGPPAAGRGGAEPSPAQAPGLPDGAAGLADYELYEFRALLEWAGLAVPPGADARRALERLRAMHRVHTEPLEQADAGVSLEPGERCSLARTVELFRMAPGAPLTEPAAPGPVLDPRAFVDGSLERERDLSAYQRVGACRFVVTDRRLLLVAPSGQQSPLPLDRIRAVRPHRNGVEVRPLRGAPVFLAFGDGVDDAAMRIHRALSDLRGGAAA